MTDTSWYKQMVLAVESGCMDQVELCITNGAKDWYWGIFSAAKAGNKVMVDFFMEKIGSVLGNINIHSYLDWGMRGAAEGGHKDLVDFFIAKGADDWNGGMYYAAEGGHLDLVKFFIDKGANAWEAGMKGAIKGGHKHLIKLFNVKILVKSVKEAGENKYAIIAALMIYIQKYLDIYLEESERKKMNDDFEEVLKVMRTWEKQTAHLKNILLSMEETLSLVDVNDDIKKKLRQSADALRKNMIEEHIEPWCLHTLI